jgi:hypothetical protein
LATSTASMAALTAMRTPSDTACFRSTLTSWVRHARASSVEGSPNRLPVYVRVTPRSPRVLRVFD